MTYLDYQAVIDDQAQAVVRLTDIVMGYTNVLEYAANKPGLAEQLEMARLYPGKFEGMLNLWEMVELCGADLSDADYKTIDTGMRIFYGIQCHNVPEEHAVYLEDGEKVTSVLYPFDMIPVLRSLLKYAGHLPMS